MGRLQQQPPHARSSGSCDGQSEPGASSHHSIGKLELYASCWQKGPSNSPAALAGCRAVCTEGFMMTKDALSADFSARHDLQRCQSTAAAYGDM